MDLEKQLTTALSNSALIFSSEFPDTPDTISVAAILMYGKSNSCKEKPTFIYEPWYVISNNVVFWQV